MRIFVGNLPLNGEQADRRPVVSSLQSLLGPLTRQLRLKFNTKTTRDGHSVCFAILTAGSERAGQKAMRKLRGKRIDGAVLEVRPYVERLASNERRALDWRVKPWHGLERRRQERRTY